MRLWHEELISFLPRQQLLGQHRECCALRGKGWGKRHSVVNYVFKHKPEKLVAYHFLVIVEMEKRGYIVNNKWKIPAYRGKNLGISKNWADTNLVYDILFKRSKNEELIYSEHNLFYLLDCLENLQDKGVNIMKILKGERV